MYSEINITIERIEEDLKLMKQAALQGHLRTAIKAFNSISLRNKTLIVLFEKELDNL